MAGADAQVGALDVAELLLDHGDVHERVRHDAQAPHRGHAACMQHPCVAALLQTAAAAWPSCSTGSLTRVHAPAVAQQQALRQRQGWPDLGAAKVDEARRAADCAGQRVVSADPIGAHGVPA